MEKALHYNAHNVCKGKDGTGNVKHSRIVKLERIENLPLCGNKTRHAFASVLLMKMDHLPRQAQDRHKECPNTQLNEKHKTAPCVCCRWKAYWHRKLEMIDLHHANNVRVQPLVRTAIANG